MDKESGMCLKSFTLSSVNPGMLQSVVIPFMLDYDVVDAV
jgi:hypothetical protein